jgi:hypothetical protein
VLTRCGYKNLPQSIDTGIGSFEDSEAERYKPLPPERLAPQMRGFLFSKPGKHIWTYVIWFPPRGLFAAYVQAMRGPRPLTQTNRAGQAR